MATQTRAYSSTRRQAQAAQTRADVLDAAIALFNERGWSGTTLAAIAEQAGVAVETIYSGYKSKKGLLRVAMDVAVAGDTEPIPYRERDETRALARGPRADRLKRGIAGLAAIHERSAGVWKALFEAATTDDEIAAWGDDFEARRKLDTQHSLELIYGRTIDPVTVDLLWALYSPEIYSKLIEHAGWTRDEYADHIVDATRRILGAR